MTPSNIVSPSSAAAQSGTFNPLNKGMMDSPVLKDLRAFARSYLEGLGYAVDEVDLTMSPYQFKGARHRVLEGRKEGGWAIADPMRWTDVRMCIRRVSWLMAQRAPSVPELVAFVIPDDLPFEIDIGSAGLRTRVVVVPAAGVRTGARLNPDKKYPPEYAMWVHIRPILSVPPAPRPIASPAQAGAPQPPPPIPVQPGAPAILSQEAKA